MWWWRKKQVPEPATAVEERLRRRYLSFRELLSFNNECLELMATLQDDLRFVQPHKAVVSDRVANIFEKAAGTVCALERLSGLSYAQLRKILEAQQNEVERFIAAREELAAPDFSRSLSEIDLRRVSEVGGKAATLGEIKNKLQLPVPEGFVLTAEAYRQFCGFPMWERVRDATHNVDLSDLAALENVSSELSAAVMSLPVPRPIEVAITARTSLCSHADEGLAVRSSALGEDGEHTFAGQFLSILNVPPEGVVDAYKQVIAGRFSARALSYRLSAGVSEVENPMPVLFLRTIRARASGIMYTRDPGNPKSDVLWITATRGLGVDVASGQQPADLFVLARRAPHQVLEQNIVHKEEELTLDAASGISRRAVDPGDAEHPSLSPQDLKNLASWGLQLEQHCKTPQDVEFVIDESGKPWIVQSRALVLASSSPAKAKSKIKQEPVLSGGRTVYPGRSSGRAHLVSDPRELASTPDGAILFLPRATPEIVEVFPRIAGLVAEYGNLTGHAAALLRESQIPSIFQMSGAFAKIQSGDPVSLDSVQPRIYAGTLWPAQRSQSLEDVRDLDKDRDPIAARLLTLHLTDPAASNFKPAGCRSAHDVLRFCHEKAISTMFEVGDLELERRAAQHSRKLATNLPVSLHVLDLGRGVSSACSTSREIQPSEITSRPFQAFWRGVSSPEVTWKRDMPASLGDFASVMSNSLGSGYGAGRPLGEKSYLLVADEYMNLNSRLAYHFSLIDACVSAVPSDNYISFRFAGGGASRQRRNLRACFIEGCLAPYGFLVDRRGDLVNAWFKKAPAEKTEANLDILGRLMACSSQLDMYMTSEAAMKWYVRQFLAGNYTFRPVDETQEEPVLAR